MTITQDKGSIVPVRLFGQQAVKVWPLVLQKVEDALAFSQGEVPAEELLRRIEDGRAILWVIFAPEGRQVLAASVCEVAVFSKRKYLRAITLGGAKFSEWGEALIEDMEEYCRENDLDGIEAVGRKGLGRMLLPHGFETVYTIFRKGVIPNE